MEIRRAAFGGHSRGLRLLRGCVQGLYPSYRPDAGPYAGGLLPGKEGAFPVCGGPGETILGYLLIKDGDGEVMWMDVLAAWPKGTGVGRRLMDHCETFLRARGKTECRLYTHVKYQRTLEIYRQRGYVIYDWVQEKGFDRYYMRKQLK